MDSEQFREFGKAMIDYIADYLENIRDRQVLPSVNPGYLQSLIPNQAPKSGENWKEIMQDVEKIVMPGITHWHSPNFHAYCPTANSYPGIVGEMLSAGIGCVGFSWVSSPACTELEVAMMNWLGKLLGLPEEFLNCSNGPGGGIIQGSASESTLIALLTAKEKKVREIKKIHPHLSEAYIKGKLVAYTSDQANSRKWILNGETLAKAVRKDKEEGLIPCYAVATLGTTGTCAFDNIEELGLVCEEENIWLHIDAAYAGSAFACPEYRHLMKGIENADSFDFNPHKWMLVNSDCSAMWVKDARYLVEAFNVERIYLKHQHEGFAPDYRHWQISLGRRFRALKVWFVLRSYGVTGIQKHIRYQIYLANIFKELVMNDKRFEMATSNMGLVCFRLNGPDILTETLLHRLTERKNIYLIPCYYRNKYVIRFVVCSRFTEVKDIEYAWNEICEVTRPILISESCKQNSDFVGMLEDQNSIGSLQISQVLPSVNPGYLQSLIPNQAPKSGENWKEIMQDVEKIVMPGITHWHSPNFHAYCPTANSYPGIVGEMLSAGIGCVGFSWVRIDFMSKPSFAGVKSSMHRIGGCNDELVRKTVGLPEEFLNCSNGPGGGIIQGSASESTLIALLTAKEKKVREIKKIHPHLSEAYIKGKLVAYTSDQANSSVEKAGLLGSMPMRLLEADENGILNGETLAKAVRKDKEEGLIPCYAVATLGTTGTCAFDNIEELGLVCEEENIWLHIDAAYAGSAFACPEYRHLMKGIENADSFDFNPHKWMLVNSDCSAMWVKDARYLVEAFNVERIYLKHQHEGFAPDYRHWQISLGRRFRALKVWFVLRSYGVTGIQKHIRYQIYLANIFKELVMNDKRFEMATSNMGLVCFRLNGPDILTETLLHRLTERKNIYLIPCYYRNKYVIRFVVCSRFTEVKDIEYAWNEICEVTRPILISESCKQNSDFVGMLEDQNSIGSLQISSQICRKRKISDLVVEKRQ
ncbi:hypothetical protein FQR65_LT01204 [Abscondita terminalis]|nr:hypothetical protein FQR65_LT01204 [Abscondita terminalis]